MTRAEQHARALLLLMEQVANFGDVLLLGESAALLREMQAAIEGAPHDDYCTIGMPGSEKCNCWKAPFLAFAQ